MIVASVCFFSVQTITRQNLEHNLALLELIYHGWASRCLPLILHRRRKFAVLTLTEQCVAFVSFSEWRIFETYF